MRTVSIMDLKLGDNLVASGEAGSIYKVCCVDMAFMVVYFTRQSDGAKIRVTADKLRTLTDNGYLKMEEQNGNGNGKDNNAVGQSVDKNQGAA